MKTPHSWQLPELTSIGRLPMSSGTLPYKTPAEALHSQHSPNSWFLLLNGDWNFSRYPTVAEADAALNDYLAGGSPPFSRTIAVPGNWTLQDTPDYPIYTNVQMPFENNPPVVPDANPTALYSISFTLPDSFSDRHTILHIGGVESYYELFVNGEFVGMAKDSRLPSEFDLTSSLTEGENEVLLKVLRFSDSSYIEDQDQWWMAGIFRDAFLYSVASARIADVQVISDYDPDSGDGICDIMAQFAWWPVTGNGRLEQQESGPEQDYTVEAELHDPAGVIWRGAGMTGRSFRRDAYEVRLRARLSGVQPWSSESPALYSLVLTLRDYSGQPVESRCVRTGFRRVQIKGRELLINGAAVLIRGVNRHEHDDRLGKVMTRERMLEDIRLLKQFNFNAVRTSHYPDTEAWYDLCDEYGIYLIDEANIEAHANYNSICRDPRWRNAFVERCTRMIARDRNHPSVIGWSAGNETGHGENHVEAIEAMRALDPSRFIHHEGEVKRLWRQGTGNEYTGGDNRYNDLVNPMYPTIESIVEHAVSRKDDRPVIPCEYSHAMGNSNGSLHEYFEAFESVPGLQGGFIWEWVDHGIARETEDGEQYWAYGGDFGEPIHDSNFVADGLIWPDRKPHPALFEFKKLAQPVAVSAVAAAEGRFRVTNKYDFRDLSHLEGRWSICVEGAVVESQYLRLLTVPPGGSVEVVLEYKNPELLEIPETTITFEFALADDTEWAERGHIVAWEQIELNRLQPASVLSRKLNARRCELLPPRSPSRVPTPITDLERFELRIEGQPIIASGPRLNLFRATTDNDGIREWTGQTDKPMVEWMNAGLHELVAVTHTVDQEHGDSGTIFIDRTEFRGTDPKAPIDCTVRYEPLADHLIRVDVSVDASLSLPSLPRIGVMLELAPGFEELTWYGRGPHENHIDRKCGAPVGVYSSTVDEQYVPYIMPQENGNKCDTRWLELGNGTRTIRFWGDPRFEFSTHHITPEDLFRCRHTPDVKQYRRPETVVCIDTIQRGVGTGSCGPQTRPQYCVQPGAYRFTFFIQVR